MKAEIKHIAYRSARQAGAVGGKWPAVDFWGPGTGEHTVIRPNGAGGPGQGT